MNPEDALTSEAPEDYRASGAASAVSNAGSGGGGERYDDADLPPPLNCSNFVRPDFLSATYMDIVPPPGAPCSTSYELVVA